MRVCRWPMVVCLVSKGVWANVLRQVASTWMPGPGGCWNVQFHFNHQWFSYYFNGWSLRLGTTLWYLYQHIKSDVNSYTWNGTTELQISFNTLHYTTLNTTPRIIWVIAANQMIKEQLQLANPDTKINWMQESFDRRRCHTTALLLVGYFSQFFFSTEYRCPSLPITSVQHNAEWHMPSTLQDKEINSGVCSQTIWNATLFPASAHAAGVFKTKQVYYIPIMTLFHGRRKASWITQHYYAIVTISTFNSRL